MTYHIEEIYKLAGRDDKVAVIDFLEGSESFKLYGSSLTVGFFYSLFERERLEKDFVAGKGNLSHGKVRATFLSGAELGDEAKASLLNVGFNSEDVAVLYPGWDSQNVFHEKKIRKIKTFTIPYQPLPKGGDYRLIYGMNKRMIAKGRLFNPHDREWHLAIKTYFEPEQLSPEEKEKIYAPNGRLKPGIEVKFLEIKFDCEEITEEESKRYFELMKHFALLNYFILEDAFVKANTTIKQVAQKNYGLLQHLTECTYKYTPHDLNFGGRIPIYLDWEGYLHVFLRHVKEFEIGNVYAGKSKFLWPADEVIMAMKKFIESIDEEIQQFWEEHPGQRFGKYKNGVVHFEGDYYTVQIEGNGRIDTFHPSEKRI